MTSLSIVIMAHPDREENATKLSQDLGAKIVWDEEGPANKDPMRRWRTGRRCWETVRDMGSEWSMVLQDDAIVCRDFHEGMEGVLDYFPDGGLVSPYTGTGRPDQKAVRAATAIAGERGESYLCTRSLNWGVAITAPTEEIDGMLDWCSESIHNPKNYDFRIGLYFRDVKGWCTWHTYPSLVDHPKSGSLIGNDGVPRVAYNFLGEENSALDVDWSRVPKHGLDIRIPTRARTPIIPGRRKVN